jgi:hypothetical protein
LLVAAAARESGAGRAFCERHGLAPEPLRDAVGAYHGPTVAGTAAVDGPLPIVLRSQVALAHAVLAGARRGDPRFTPEELFLALLEDDVALRGVIGALLDRVGVSPASARAEIATLSADPRAT